MYTTLVMEHPIKRLLLLLYLSVQFDHANFGQFSDLRFNLEIFVFSSVIFASSIPSEKPTERLRVMEELSLNKSQESQFYLGMKTLSELNLESSIFNLLACLDQFSYLHSEILKYDHSNENY